MAGEWSGRLREVRAEGSSRDLGSQHGRACSDLIEKTYTVRMRRAARNRSESDVLERAKCYIPFAERYVPELLEEVSGLADGAEISLAEAFFLQVATELELAAQGCTSLGVASVGVEPFVAQNWDQPHDSRGNQVVLHLLPIDRPAILMFTHAGTIGYIGLNSHGVGIVQNQLYAATKPMGLTGYFIIRKLLSFETVPAGLAWLRGVRIGSTCNYIVGDALGNLVDIELGDGSFRSTERPLQLHTNHYMLPGCRSVDRVASQLPDSGDRLMRLSTLLYDTQNEERAVRALSDHDGYPASICRHEEDPGLRTTASILLRLRKTEMSVCYDNPCRGEYQTYRLGTVE